MKIYTSYFANAKKLEAAGIVPIGIALYRPRFFSGKNINMVAPTKDMLSTGISEEEYTKRYLALLKERLDVRTFLDYLRQMGNGKDVALCCYEKPGDFCHRHLLAKYLMEKNSTLTIEEFKPAEQIKSKKESSNGLLFQ